MENGMYKAELHAHTSETSPCARVKAADMIRAMAQARYDIVVVTDHFNNYVLEAKPGSPEERVKRYLKGYECACRAAKEENIKVFLGAEVCLHHYGPEDYLLYGITREFLYNNPEMYEYSQEKLYQECVKANVLLVQAHPCRSYCNPSDPKFLHGVEVINSNCRHDNRNDRVIAWWKAQKAAGYPLIPTSGSDYHQVEDIGNGGIRLTAPVRDAVELADILRSGDYELRGE